MFPTLAALTALLRIGAGLNKYLVWAIMAMLIQFARRTTPIVPDELRISSWPEWAWPVLAATTMVRVHASIRMLVLPPTRASQQRQPTIRGSPMSQVPCTPPHDPGPCTLPCAPCAGFAQASNYFLFVVRNKGRRREVPDAAAAERGG